MFNNYECFINLDQIMNVGLNIVSNCFFSTDKDFSSNPKNKNNNRYKEKSYF